MNSRHATTRQGHGAAREGGFSLIEVLIAIVVLALGLLGLAAVFPVVVTQQRQATDSVQGVSMERTVADALLNDGRLTQPTLNNTGTFPPPQALRRGWDIIVHDANWSPYGEWVLAPDTSASTSMEYSAAGGVVFRNGSTDVFTVGMVERLTPQAESVGAATEPRYVWDFVTRRQPGGLPRLYAPGDARDAARVADDNVQVAMFVRRIDPGIRKPVITNPPPGGLPSVLAAAIRAGLVAPVAVDPSTGVPTGNGVGAYSQVTSFTYTVAQTGLKSSTIYVYSDQVNSPLRPYAMQVGQKFVDQLGVVHTVRRIVTGTTPGDTRRLAVIEPAVSTEALNVFLTEQGSSTYQMIYTPQVPVAVVVNTVNRRRL